MLKIGLTGGIGCGKTTITDLFSTLNVPIIDADLVAHELVEPGQPALKVIVSLFGKRFITPTGHLNRPALRELVFKQPDAKKQLDHLIHPLVYQEINSWLAQQTSDYVIFSIPLLLETKQQSIVDRILVIDLPQTDQIKRVMLRDGLTKEVCLRIISSQVSRTERRLAADDLILNNHSIHSLQKQVSQLHHFYLKLAKIAT